VPDQSPPSPPFPAPDNPRLELTVREAQAHLAAGESVNEVLIWAVIHGWFEGYIDAAGEHMRPSGGLPDDEAEALREQVRLRGVGPAKVGKAACRHPYANVDNDGSNKRCAQCGVPLPD